MAVSVYVPQAASVEKWTLVSSAARTSSDVTENWPCDFFSSEEISLVCTSCSGTLNLYLQKLLPDDSSYADIASWSQITTAGAITTSGNITLSFVNGGNSLTTQTDAGLTANTVNTVHFGSRQRLKWVIAGTGATVTFGVFGSFRA